MTILVNSTTGTLVMCEGIVYIIRAVGTDFYKVGYTKDDHPEKRVSSMQTGCPLELKIIAYYANKTVKDERYLHGLMEIYHVRGEWFRYNVILEKLLYPEYSVDMALEGVETFVANTDCFDFHLSSYPKKKEPF